MSRSIIPIALALVGSVAHADPEASATPPDPTGRAEIHALQQTAADWQRWLSAVSALRRYSADFSLSTRRGTDAALSRGNRSRSTLPAWRFIDGPFEWSIGARKFWIVNGRSHDASLLAVFSPRGEAPEHRASLIIAEPNAPLAIGWSAARPDELLFTTCYGCPGESGSIVVSEDGQPTFVYR